MAGTTNKKRTPDGRLQRPTKKQKRIQDYQSGSESDADFDAVNLLDSDDDIHNAKVDDIAASDDGSGSSDEEVEAIEKPKKEAPRASRRQEQASEDESEPDDSDSDDDGGDFKNRKPMSKRNDPAAFATSLSKILSTKLSTSKRSDPVLARSAAAHEASKAAVDNALEVKARKQLRDEKRKAMEKGRVRDVLVATAADTTDETQASAAGILETERRLRKVAQRGVVKLFNAVRAAQVKAVETEKGTKKDGVLGMNRREGKVNEMSKKGFLELIASGGGGLKKGALEEA